MIIASAPLRISLLGGGSDYPEHFESHGGSVFGFSISKRTYVSALRIDPRLVDHGFKLAYRTLEEVKDIAHIQHDPFRVVLSRANLQPGWEFSVSADLPAYTGLGSSSSFLVALIALTKTIQNDAFSTRQIALEAFNVERNLLEQKVGLQDQVFAAFGSQGSIRFSKHLNFEFIEIDKSKLKFIEDSCILVSTGTKRKAASIVKSVAENAHTKRSEMSDLAALAREAHLLAESGSLNEVLLADLIDQGWNLKKKLSHLTSNAKIDEQMDLLKKNGALGMKLLGAGGGGFIFVVLPRGKKEAFINRLPNFHYVEFKFDSKGVIVSHL